MRKKWIVGVLVALLTFGGVAYAADAVAPTLTDVYNLLQEIKAELAVVKQQTAPGASANTNQAGELAKATSSDGKVTIDAPVVNGVGLLAGVNEKAILDEIYEKLTGGAK